MEKANLLEQLAHIVAAQGAGEADEGDATPQPKRRRRSPTPDDRGDAPAETETETDDEADLSDDDDVDMSREVLAEAAFTVAASELVGAAEGGDRGRERMMRAKVMLAAGLLANPFY